MTAVFIIAFLGTLLIGGLTLLGLAAIQRRQKDAISDKPFSGPEPTRIRPSTTPTYAALVAERPEVARIMRDVDVARQENSALRLRAAFRAVGEAMRGFAR